MTWVSEGGREGERERMNFPRLKLEVAEETYLQHIHIHI